MAPFLPMSTQPDPREYTSLHSPDSSISDATLSYPPSKCGPECTCKDFDADDDEEERQLIDPDIVRDVVIGLSDGLTVPFALTAGLSSLGESHLVVIGGLAELIAGAISMGIGGFLAAQSERDHHLYMHSRTTARVLRSCPTALERQVHAILGPLGVDQHVSSLVTGCLRKAEVDSDGDGDGDTGMVHEKEKAGARVDEAGMTAFLLKFKNGLEEIPARRMYISALTISSAYFTGGIIPLLPYFFTPSARTGLLYSSLLTGLVLLLFGAIKAHVTGASAASTRWRYGGYVWGALSMLLVGGCAAGAAYAIVKMVEGSE